MHPDLRQLGQDALNACDHDQSKAREWIIRQFLDNRDLFELHVLPIIENTASSILRYVAGQERLAIRTDRQMVGPYGPRDKSRTREVPPTPRLMKGHALLAERNWLQYPIGDMVLGDLTKDALLKSASWYLNAGRTNTVTGNFLLQVAESLPDFTTPVRVIWDSQKLATLHETMNATAA